MSSPSTDLRKRAFLAVGQGVLTGVYYATPDFISSKARRGLAKTALAAGIAGLAASEYDGISLRRRDEPSDLLTHPAAQAPGELLGGPSDRNDATHPVVGADDVDAGRHEPRSEAEPTPDKTFSDFWISLSPAGKLGLGAVAAALAVGSVAVTVVGERAIYRFGERRAARGVAAAHTKTGLVMGGLTTLLALIPPPEDK